MTGTNSLIGLRVFLRNNRLFIVLCGWVCLFVALGVFCAARSESVCSVFGLSGYSFLDYLSLFGFIFGGYLVLSAACSVFLLGPMIILPAISLLGLSIGFCGYSAVYLFGWAGLWANALICLPLSCLFVFYIYHAAQSVGLSLLMGSNLFGKARGTLFSLEIKRYLILDTVMAPVSLALSAVISLILMLFDKIM